MTEIILYLSVILLLVKPLGLYMARVYDNKPCILNRLGRPLEHFVYRFCRIDPTQEMPWTRYLCALLFFNFMGLIFVYIIQRCQFYLPFNPQHFSAVPPDLAFNTSASYVTNTNWQAYSGESTLSYFTQMTALTVQNFMSATTGMSLLMAFIRGLRQRENKNLGNFWVDSVRGTLYILLPLSFILAVALTSQGVIQNNKPYQKISALEKSNEQLIPMGPVASQVAIKQLGSNGGGFFNTNSAHPFENPTPLSHFLEMLAILLIPASLCYTFGVLMEDERQGWVLLFVMFILFISLVSVTVTAEKQANPALIQLGVDQIAKNNLTPGGNMEGKETRFGVINSALWATATTTTSNGSVNAMLGSFTPLGGLIPLWSMQLGEVIFGGVGSGLYGMLMFIILTVFLSGLMVGRTPEYAGKKIESYEIKMASMAVLVMPLVVLFFTGIATVTSAGTAAVSNPGAHGLTEMLYAFTSMVNNNGSALIGLNANTPFYNILGGIAMLMGRYGIAIPTLALAGSLALKKRAPSGIGTLSTQSPIFIILLISVILMLGALTFLPVLALGPIVEQLMTWHINGH